MPGYLVAGNWKMHGSIEFCQSMGADLLASDCPQVEILVCPPTLYIPQMTTIFEHSGIQVGGQNCHFEAQGAYTGEVSPLMLRDFGCSYVILGHSERRQYFAETSELVAKKTVAALQAGLKPIVCVGETEAQRAAQTTFDVIKAQVNLVLDDLSIEDLLNLVIAYEPVWAIGTGQTATPTQAQEVHAFIRELVAQRDANAAAMLQILYGGSVKPSNATELFQQQDINGGLIGGASLNAEDFITICRKASEMP